MEFAVEAQKLLGDDARRERRMSAGRGRVARALPTRLRVGAREVRADDARSCAASTSRSARARCTRSWGRTAPARARSRGVLAGREAYGVTGGTGALRRRRTSSRSRPRRARAAGVFLGFQYPVEIPGVGNLYFLRTALNAIRRARGEEELDAIDFLSLAKEKMKLVELDPALRQPLGQRGVLRRREEAERDLPDGGARAAPRDPRRDRLGARHRRAADRRGRRERAARARIAASSSSPTTSGCSSTSAGPRARAWRAGGSSGPAGRSSPTSSSRPGTPGSPARRRSPSPPERADERRRDEPRSRPSRPPRASRPGSPTRAARRSGASRRWGSPRRATRTGASRASPRSAAVSFARAPRGDAGGGRGAARPRGGAGGAAARLRERPARPGALLAAAALPRAAVLSSLAEALRELPDQVRPHLGRLARPDDHAFVAANAALFEDGGFVLLPRGAASSTRRSRSSS